MAALTTEYLDKVLDQKFENQFRLTQEYLDEKLAAQTQELKSYSEEQVEKLAVMVQRSVVEPLEQRFDRVELRLDRIDLKFEKLENALSVKL